MPGSQRKSDRSTDSIRSLLVSLFVLVLSPAGVLEKAAAEERTFTATRYGGGHYGDAPTDDDTAEGQYTPLQRGLYVPKEEPTYRVPPEEPTYVMPSTPPIQDVTPAWWHYLVPRRNSARVTWLASGGDNGLGMTGVNFSTSLGGPTPWAKSMLSVSPSFGVQFLDGPKGVPLPDTLYRGSLSFSLMKPLSENKQLMLGFAPGFASDLEAGGSDVFRIMAFASVMWQKSPQIKWNFGVAATGRSDIPILPMAGLIWTPNENWQIDIGAPRPRIARRVSWLDPACNDWVYIAGEFGGGTWAVDRNGVDDELTIRDFRLVVGWERKAKGQLNANLEAGYVFGRTFEYESDDFDFDPDDTFMIRAGLSY